MHDLKEIRKDFEVFKKALEKRSTEINFDKLKNLDILNRELIHKKEKFSVRVQLTALFNKQARQIGNYIKDELKHLVIKS